MSVLTTQQQTFTAAYWANAVFTQGNTTAIYSLDKIILAIAAVDAAFDTTLSTAVAAVGGSTTIANGLSGQITASLPGASAMQQTLLVCHVLMARAGLIL